MSEAPKQFSSQKELMDYVDHCTAGVVAQRDALLAALKGADEIYALECQAQSARATLNDNHRHRTVESLKLSRLELEQANQKISARRKAMKDAIAAVEAGKVPE